MIRVRGYVDSAGNMIRHDRPEAGDNAKHAPFYRGLYDVEDADGDLWWLGRAELEAVTNNGRSVGGV